MAHGWDAGREPWNDPKYFDMSLPSGTRHAQWRSARSDYQRDHPGDDTTLNERLFPDRARELRASEPPEDINMDCFVATSAFEGQDHRTVDSLRAYRDEVLSETALGRTFISAYYGGLGQAGARVLDLVPGLKPLVRYSLDTFVDRIVEPALQARPTEELYK